MAIRILVADDEPEGADLVAFGCRINWPGCEVYFASNGNDALKLFEELQPDLLILDINMPPPTGFDVCRQVRQISQVPIMMLTGRDSAGDKVRALDMGADDYLVKPFDPSELLARLRAILRRAVDLQGGEAAAVVAGRGDGKSNGHGQGVSTTGSASSYLKGDGAAPAVYSTPNGGPDLVVGDISIDTRLRKVLLRDRPVQLTSTEYRLLKEMATYPGKTLAHDFLLEQVWGPEYVGEDHYLKVFVRRLRQKLGDDAEQPRYIQTEWGKGYRLAQQ
jgi:DNA-binding response OmpR family regulator